MRRTAKHPKSKSFKLLKPAVIAVAYTALVILTVPVPTELAATESEPVYEIVYVDRVLECSKVHVEDVEPITEPELQEINSIELNDNDYQLLCKVVAAEARGEGYEGMMAVAQVIRDRMEHANTTMYGGPTVRGVVLKSGQFAKPWSGDLSKYPDISRAVDAVFINSERIFEEPTLFFYYPKMSTSSGAAPIRRYNYVGQVGVHHFHGDRKIND